MRLKLMKTKKNTKDLFLNAWYTSMKPVANLADKINETKYERLRAECKSISDQELMRRYAKHIISQLVKKSYINSEKFIVFNKTSQAMTYEFENRILHKIRNINSKDKILNSWYLHNDKAKLYYKDESEEMINYEKKLNKLLKQELEDLGAKVEYKVQTGADLSKSYPEIRQMWLDRIGYEKTLVVSVN